VSLFDEINIVCGDVIGKLIIIYGGAIGELNIVYGGYIYLCDISPLQVMVSLCLL